MITIAIKPALVRGAAELEATARGLRPPGGLPLGRTHAWFTGLAIPREGAGILRFIVPARLHSLDRLTVQRGQDAVP